MATCAFCGGSGKLTGEHVFGDWLSKIGLDLGPVPHGAGPLNRSALSVFVPGDAGRHPLANRADWMWR